MARGCFLSRVDCLRSSMKVIFEVWTCNGFSIKGWLRER